VVVQLDERSRCFLVKQGHASSICRLNLSGLDDALAVISASTDNIAVLHAVLERQAAAASITVDALVPEQWLEEFQSCRKDARRIAHPLST
jgi:type IV secretion system protein VirB4